MDTAEFFLKGLMVGFLVSAPVGPVAIMCIHRTIAHGPLAGYISGLGATFADTIFGAIAALGLGFLAADLIANQGWLQIAGGIILCALGLRLSLSRHLSKGAESQERVEEQKDAQLSGGPDRSPTTRLRPDIQVGYFVSAFAVMITNPITLISFAAIFAAIDIARIGEKTYWGLALVAGVFSGAAVWWGFLVLVSGMFRLRFTEKGILWVGRCSGILILAFGIIILFFPEIMLRGRLLDQG